MAQFSLTLTLWKFSPDTDYWRNSSYLIEFQNHRARFILSGSNIHLDGRGTGGIDGNGDVWYDEDRGTSTEGRPMV
jgi:galacturan 1,4-alpha-galacturonidase